MAPYGVLLDCVKRVILLMHLLPAVCTVQYSADYPSLILLSLSTWQRCMCGISQSHLTTLRQDICPTSIGCFQFVRTKTTLFEASDKYQEGKKPSAVDLLEHTMIETSREGI